MEEYVVAFRPSEINVRSVVEDKTFCQSELIDLYTFAISRYGNKYGDAVSWNNRIWSVVQAENARDALEKVIELWINERGYTNE